MDRHIFLCVFVCLWTVQITGLYGEFIEEISTGHDFGRYRNVAASPRSKHYFCLRDAGCELALVAVV